MNSAWTDAFIESTRNVFETMLRLPIETDVPVMRERSRPVHDVSGIIGVSGDMEGTVVLSFPVSSATRIVKVFTRMAVSQDSPDFADGIGELVNMIAGGAKARFGTKRTSIGCPSVVIGCDHVVLGRKDVVNVVIPCTCDCGEFAVQLALRPAEANESESASAPAAVAAAAPATPAA